MKEWFSAAEIAAMRLPAVPTVKANVIALADREEWKNRPRNGRGGGLEYHYSAIPAVARAKIALDANPAPAAEKPQAGREEIWAWFSRLSPKKRAKAQEKLAALEAIEALVRSGTGKLQAMMLVAQEAGVQVSSLYAWEAATRGFARADWLPALAPRQAGAGREADCSPDAWAFIKADYLRPEKPAFSGCYRRLQTAATEHGWTIPAGRTLERRLLALPTGVRVLARDGAEALKRMYPAQVRDRGVFHALEAVNADGHRWDVFVKWPDGQIGRPMMVAFQDLYSGKILAWRISETAHKGAVRLAFGDLVEEWGIPDYCWLDNGRDFASKWLTGGTPNRYRFKLKDDEPAGIMTQLGVGVHWTTPYAGQSKPIERAFRDFAGELAKHPKFAGAYVGNSPMAKPENYGKHAVPLDLFVQTVAEGIAEHNARAGRRTPVAAGRSFDATFAESYERSPIRRATAEQRRLWLLAAEGVGVASVDGSVRLMGNRYWAPFLLDYRGQKVAVRFDPEALQEDLQVYRLDGAYLGAAACTEAAGFADVDAAREHAKARKSWLRSQKEMLAAERKMSIADVAALLPKGTPPEAPERRVVRMATNNLAVAAVADEQPDVEKHLIAGMRKLRLAANDGLTLGGGDVRGMSETADDRVEGPVDHEAVRAAVRETGLPGSDVAKQSGVGYSTVSAFLAGKYAGDNDKVARSLVTWLESRSAAARTRALLPRKPTFVKTATAEAILTALEHAQYVQDLVVVTGGAGVGKTTACEHYQRGNPNVWLATAEPSLSSTHAMLEYLCETIGVAENAPNRRSRAIVQRVRGSAGLLIVDEAQHLTSQALDQLRTIHDKAEVGVALVGNEAVYARLDGGGRQAQFAQLFSRVGMRVARPKPLKKDIEAILDAGGITGTEERRLLRAIAGKPGALRGLQKCLRVAHMIAMGAGAESADAGHIQAAWARLADTAPLDDAA